MVLEYMDRGTAQHLSKEGLLDLEGTPRASQHCLSLHYHCWHGPAACSARNSSWNNIYKSVAVLIVARLLPAELDVPSHELRVAQGVGALRHN